MLADFPDLSRDYILIVDDEPHNLEAAQAVLELLYNAHVVSASNGQSALDTLTAEITIILCDLMMPGMSGYELLPELRKRTRVPVIALTASAMNHEREQAIAAGFDGFIPKPFEADRLAADILACIAAIRAKQSQPHNVAPDGVDAAISTHPGVDTIAVVSTTEQTKTPVGEHETLTVAPAPVGNSAPPASAATLLPVTTIPNAPQPNQPTA